MRLFFLIAGVCFLSADLRGATAQEVKAIPPQGIEIPAEVKESLTKRLAEFDGKIESLKKSKSFQLSLLPDIEVLTRAVRLAIDLHGFYETSDFDKANELLDEAAQRIEQLSNGRVMWTQAHLTVRGFRSEIDGSIQPYGVYGGRERQPDGAKFRCDIWCHGRGEKTLELQFIHQRLKQVGEISPPNTIVIHPFGRYCNANKFAGEVDTFEALAHAKSQYPIDENRVSIRGFSMGGAAAWHLAVHHPDKWFAANPGAGFADTPGYLGLLDKPDSLPAGYEQTLWKLYDCPPSAVNLRMLPTVAYSGELDKQKLAADTMAKACFDLPRIGFELTHIIGPDTEHRIHPDSKAEVERRLAILAKQGRNRTPHDVHFATYTLKYNKAFWLEVTGLEKHWERAELHGILDLDSPRPTIWIKSEGATGIAIHLDADQLPQRVLDNPAGPVQISVNGEFVSPSPLRSDRSLSCSMAKTEKGWVTEAPGSQTGLAKRHNLQGPIDDAFMGPFLFVLPSQPCRNEAVDKWVKAEMERAMREWKSHFRGEVHGKLDFDVTAQDIRNYNLICWGDSAANAIIARVADKLPLKWDDKELRAGAATFTSANHVAIAIYPNPLQPKRYIVLNSGFTFRGVDYSSNARQTPKLPDWAVVDVSVPADERAPGKVAAADFFGEKWELRE